MNAILNQLDNHKINVTHGFDTPDQHANNMVECLQYLVSVRPNDTGLVTVKADGDSHFSYQQLEVKVLALASVLQKQFTVGDRALILHDNDEHYVISFLACLYAGIIAVPVFPPESMKEKHLARLLLIAEDATPACLLTTNHFLTMFGNNALLLSKIASIAVDDVNDELAEQWCPYNPNTDSIAFLQYTSGSTSAPKGVMVSHGNLLANGLAAKTGFAAAEHDIAVSWLPLYHDMGLMGGLLQPIFVGVPVILMSPNFFLQRPIRWLETISRYRGTVSGGPDFAYRLCLERIKESQLTELDLSCWRVAFSGAEPIRHDTLELFSETLSRAGLSAEAIFPCYGLAEATLYVSGSVAGKGMVATQFCPDDIAKHTVTPKSDGKKLVSCGYTAKNHQTIIMSGDSNENFTRLAESTIGEIWISGPSVAVGYWQNDKATADTYIEYNGQRWLRSGDLGFIYQQQLYITGRVKDLIILRGYNVYPQDIEKIVEDTCDFVRKGRVAAFSVTKPDGTEGIGLAMEVPVRLQKSMPAELMFEQLAYVIAEQYQEPLSVAILLNRAALPKTSSGKLQRSACRNGWQDNTLDSYASYQFGTIHADTNTQLINKPIVEIENELQQAIANIWCDILENSDLTLSPTSHFFMVGGNSLLALRVLAALEETFDINIPPADFITSPTIAELANLVELTLIQEIEDATV
ncbi:AMP-binding protein [Alteromonas sp. 5E99-2]|uniref:AMP-binding protein n=1 Tax=Alteromonas sp. 5E99-2 TaxID=2817683 RepID=UPI001A98CD0E|nr:AMP-binding protein [Alteromonas sp. 5E99-2]MBO1255579.1 AMP-binding protein [Alteromonas sp. 5E99-2]